MSEFKREERFIVIKRKHLYVESRVYESLEQELRVWLDKHLIPTSECVVVEADWPEYEQVWRMIEARVTGQQSDYDRLEAENRALRANEASFDDVEHVANALLWLGRSVPESGEERAAYFMSMVRDLAKMSERSKMLRTDAEALRSRLVVVPDERDAILALANRIEEAQTMSISIDIKAADILRRMARLNGKTVSEELLSALLKSAEKLSDRAVGFSVSGVEFVEIGDNNSTILELEVALDELRTLLDKTL